MHGKTVGELSFEEGRQMFNEPLILEILDVAPPQMTGERNAPRR